MAYTANVYQGDHIAATDLQNIENNFEYLRTNFKADGAPADPGGGLEGVLWYDDNVDTLKVRDSGAWRGVFSGEASFKIWAYLDVVPDGWTRDSNVSDEVLAFKGGAQYTTGAQRNKGAWKITGIENEDAHTHTVDNHYHSVPYDNWSRAAPQPAGQLLVGTGVDQANIDGATGDNTSGGATPGTDGGDAHTHTQDASWRIKAAVGILLYPKM